MPLVRGPSPRARLGIRKGIRTESRIRPQIRAAEVSVNLAKKPRKTMKKHK